MQHNFVWVFWKFKGSLICYNFQKPLDFEHCGRKLYSLDPKMLKTEHFGRFEGSSERFVCVYVCVYRFATIKDSQVIILNTRNRYNTIQYKL